MNIKYKNDIVNLIVISKEHVTISSRMEKKHLAMFVPLKFNSTSRCLSPTTLPIREKKKKENKSAPERRLFLQVILCYIYHHFEIERDSKDRKYRSK